MPRIDRIYEQTDKSKDFKPIQIEGYFVAPSSSNGARPKVKPKFGKARERQLIFNKD